MASTATLRARGNPPRIKPLSGRRGWIRTSKTHHPRHLDEAVEAVDRALEEYGKAQAAFLIEGAKLLRERIHAAKGNRTPPRPPVTK